MKTKIRVSVRLKRLLNRFVISRMGDIEYFYYNEKYSVDEKCFRFIEIVNNNLWIDCFVYVDNNDNLIWSKCHYNYNNDCLQFDKNNAYKIKVLYDISEEY